MTRTTQAIAVVALLALSLAAPLGVAATQSAVGVAASQSGAATLSLSDAAAPTGETVAVTLATDASDVAGYQTKLTFDSSVLRVQSVSGADYDDPVANVNNDEGWVYLTQSRSNGMDAPTLATITFEVVGDTGDASAVEFVAAETLVNDGNAETIDVSTDPATVAVGDEPVNNAAVPADPLGLDVGLPIYAIGGAGIGVVLAVGVLLGRRL